MKRREVLRLFVAAGPTLTGLAACTTAPEMAPVPIDPVTGQPVKLEEQPYRLGPNDKVKITVFRHEDLSGEFTLDGNGFLSLPLIGEVRAAGLTARELEDELERRYGDGYLVDPKISIEILNYRPFTILGEVKEPGQYPYEPGMTVIDAVAKAGGFTFRARQNRIYLRRGPQAPEVVVPANTPVQPGDIITVPERFF